MKKKFLVFSACSLILSVLIFILTYFIFHYLTPDGFTSVLHAEPCKPFITLLFGILGTLFLFSGISAFLISLIFYKK